MIYRRFSSLNSYRRIARAQPRSIARLRDRYRKKDTGPVFYDTFSDVGAFGGGVPESADPALLFLTDPFINAPSVGDYLKIDNEILQISNNGHYPARLVVTRAHFGTPMTAHSSGASILSDQSQAVSWYNSGYKVAASCPLFTVSNGTGWSYPLADAGPGANITIAAGDLIKINDEIILINDASGHPRMEVVAGGRGYYGTTTAAHAPSVVYVNHS
tara:strand:+ start:6213 stop:6860 length:648 start_codon:yes stop_codon:yes gene_type:complete